MPVWATLMVLPSSATSSEWLMAIWPKLLVLPSSATSSEWLMAIWPKLPGHVRGRQPITAQLYDQLPGHVTASSLPK